MIFSKLLKWHIFQNPHSKVTLSPPVIHLFTRTLIRIAWHFCWNFFSSMNNRRYKYVNNPILYIFSRGLRLHLNNRIHLRFLFKDDYHIWKLNSSPNIDLKTPITIKLMYNLNPKQPEVFYNLITPRVGVLKTHKDFWLEMLLMDQKNRKK